MAYGFCGKISAFLQLASGGHIGNHLSNERERTGATALSAEEQAVWNQDGLILADVLGRVTGDGELDCCVVAEYDIPGHLGRCDLIFLGKDAKGVKHAAVLELKRWDNFTHSGTLSYVQVGGQYHPHPVEQALGYRDRLVYFHQRAAEFDWHAAALMTVMSSTRCAALNGLVQSGPVWCLNQPELAIRHLKQWFVQPLLDPELNTFVTAPCLHNASLAQNLLLRLPNLTRGVFNAIGGRPLDLSPRQEEVVSAILREIRRAEKVLVIVSGEPGCGKTIVGLHSVIHQLAETTTQDDARRSVLALRNNRLCTVVRAALDDAGVRVGPALVQYIKGGGPNVGIYPQVRNAIANHGRLPIYDLIVVDEAHRVPNEPGPNSLTQLSAVLRAGRAVVCLVDEGQVLNDDDNGTPDVIQDQWRRLFPNAPIIHMALEEQHRCPSVYSQWLSDLLTGRITTFPANFYEFQVASDPDEVRQYLRTHTGLGECGLLASYTVCNGRRGNDIRVPELGVRWLMTPDEYNVFWRDRRFRHRFDRCASVYGCQGFELDYAGLFWGKDLKMMLSPEGVRFDLFSPHDVQDDIRLAYGTRLRELANIAEHDDYVRDKVVRVLLHRYGILLSRARKGMAVYCEDPETAATLRRCLY